jgi:hypothetical protein
MMRILFLGGTNSIRRLVAGPCEESVLEYSGNDDTGRPGPNDDVPWFASAAATPGGLNFRTKAA